MTENDTRTDARRLCPRKNTGPRGLPAQPTLLCFPDLATIHHPLRWRHGGAELACESVPSSGGLLLGFATLCGHERWIHPRLPGRTAWQIRATLEVE